MKRKKYDVVSMIMHGFFLTSLNLFAILLSFTLFVVFNPSNQLIFQAFTALFLNIALYYMVYFMMKRLGSSLMMIPDLGMLLATIGISLALLPVVFFPLSYLSQGYWISVDNLFVVWPYQLMANGICLIISFFVLKNKKG